VLAGALALEGDDELVDVWRVVGDGMVEEAGLLNCAKVAEGRTIERKRKVVENGSDRGHWQIVLRRLSLMFR